MNGQIQAHEVRLVGDNVEEGIYPIEKALQVVKSLQTAQGDEQLDLVEISPNAKPPVCKIIQYSKFKYEQKKKQKEIKAKAHKTTIKEIRLGPNTDEHDFSFKLKHAIKFLSDGAKVKVYVHFAGRTIAFKERGEILLLKFVQALEEYGKMEYMPKMEGRRMNLIVAPKITKK